MSANFYLFIIFFQIAMVSGILAYSFGATFAWITSLSVASYVAFTLLVTQVLCFHDTRLSKISMSMLSNHFSGAQFLILAFVYTIFPPVVCNSIFFFWVQWRTKFRQAMNKADNDASTRVVDSLLNYEVRHNVCLLGCLQFLFLFLFLSTLSFNLQTVKYFNNESFEVAKYDTYLQSELSSSLST